MIRRYAISPDPHSGYDLDDMFSIVVPLARTNLILNPSVETNTTGYTNVSAGIIRSTTQAYYGAYHLLLATPAIANDGVYYTTSTLTAGVTYVFSLKVLGLINVGHKIAFATNAGTTLVSRAFLGTGRWQWQWIFYTPTSTATHRLYLTRDNTTPVGTTRTDGWQLESCADGYLTPTTYIDGDQQGLVTNQSPPAYIWNGTPHASTSTRSGLTRAGGMVVKFKDYNLFLTAIIGLGLAVPQNVRTEYARLDGAYDDYTRKPTRQFSLVGTFQGRSYQELRDNRSQIARLLDRDLVGLDQRMMLLHHIEGPCGDTQTNESRVLCKYVGGMDGNTDNQVLENAAIQFEQYLPFVVSDQETGAAFDVQDTIANANYIMLRSASGVWQAIGTGGNDIVAAVTFGNDEYLYIGGKFTSFNAVANTPMIARYSLETGLVTAMGTGGAGAGAFVEEIAQAPNGNVWAVGNFTSMGGAANSAAVAEWTGAAWSGHTYPGGADVTSVAIGITGIVYVGDTTGKIYSWNGAAWTLLGTAAGGSSVNSVTIGPDGYLYVSGQFTSVSGVGATNVARYSLTAGTWSALSGTSPSGAVFYKARFGPNGMLYQATSGTPYLYRWNGTAWVSIGGLSGGTFARALFASQLTGNVYVSGDFTTANGVALPDAIGLWNGATIVPIGIDLPGTATAYSLAERNDGTFAVGYSTSGTATSGGQATMTNSGTGRTYPTVRIAGPSSGTSRIYEIRNLTTGRSIYLSYTINAGEVATLVFQPDSLSFQSSFVGNLARFILPGSAETDFSLQPGANVLSFFSADNTVTAVIYWRPCFVSLDDVR